MSDSQPYDDRHYSPPKDHARDLSHMIPEKVRGYRELDRREIDAINAVKRWEDELGDFITALRNNPNISVDGKFATAAVTHFQQGFMALTRAIAQPESRLK